MNNVYNRIKTNYNKQKDNKIINYKNNQKWQRKKLMNLCKIINN